MRLFAIIGCVLVCAGAAQAKDFVAVVLVGADGRSVVVRPPPRVIDGLFDLGIQGGARASAAAQSAPERPPTPLPTTIRS